MMETIEQKALAACQDYVHWKAQIKKLSSAIGGNLHLCETSKAKDSQYLGTHLAEAYRPDHDEYRTSYMTPQDIVEFLGTECKYCLAAHNLIQERKLAKQKLGHAKRQISKIGKVQA